jgi:hypothetical protein
VPAARCLGGRFSACRDGHAGRFCSVCQPGWFMDTDDLCARCQEPAFIAMLYLAQFSFLVILILVLLFASDAFVNQVEFVLLNIRCVGGKHPFT